MGWEWVNVKYKLLCFFINGFLEISFFSKDESALKTVIRYFSAHLLINTFYANIRVKKPGGEVIDFFFLW